MVFKKLIAALREGHEKRREQKLTKALAVRSFTKLVRKKFSLAKPPKTVRGRRLSLEETLLFVREEKESFMANRDLFLSTLKKKGVSAVEFVALIDDAKRGVEPFKSRQKRLLKRYGVITLSQINTSLGLGEFDRFICVLEVVKELYASEAAGFIPVDIAMLVVLGEIFHLDP